MAQCARQAFFPDTLEGKAALVVCTKTLTNLQTPAAPLPFKDLDNDRKREREEQTGGKKKGGKNE